MSNLIPPSARKALTKEYWKRVVSVWLLLLSGAILLVGALLYPTYQYLESQLAVYSEAYSEVQSKAGALQEIRSSLNSDKQLALSLFETASDTPASFYFELIDSLGGAGITINSFRDLRSEDLPNITIAGQASNRQALISFSESLSGSEEFTSADYPTSILASNEDIDFNIKVILTTD